MLTTARGFVALPTLPANNATVTLFSNFPKLSEAASVVRDEIGAAVNLLPDGPAYPRIYIDEVSFVFNQHANASAANGLRFYSSNNQGVTWYESDMKSAAGAAQIGSGAGGGVQIPALTPPAEYVKTFTGLGKYQGVRFTYTAGATAPTGIKATYSFQNGGGSDRIKVEAKTIGIWGNDVTATIADATDANANHFNLTISYNGVSTTYQNVDVTSGNDTTAAIVDPYVNVTKLGDGRPVNVAATNLATGRDGWLGHVAIKYVSAGSIG